MAPEGGRNRSAGAVASRRRRGALAALGAVGVLMLGIVGVAAWIGGEAETGMTPSTARAEPPEAATRPTLVAAAPQPNETASRTEPSPPGARAPMSAAALLDLERNARDAFVRGDTPRSVSLYRRVLAHAPRRASAWRGLGLVSAAAGDRATARRALVRYLGMNPDAPDRVRIVAELARAQ
jgi:hypothetical protein